MKFVSPSTLRIVPLGSLSRAARKRCPTQSVPALVDSAYWNGAHSLSNCFMCCLIKILATNRLNELPVTMPRTPPSGLVRNTSLSTFTGVAFWNSLTSCDKCPTQICFGGRFGGASARTCLVRFLCLMRLLYGPAFARLQCQFARTRTPTLRLLHREKLLRSTNVLVPAAR